MTNYADLVKRLGYHSENPATGKLQLTNPDGPAAADAIETLLKDAAADKGAMRVLATRVETAERERDAWKKEAKIGDRQVQEANLYRQAAEAEVKRLREALTKVHDMARWSKPYEPFLVLARAALEASHETHR